MIKVGILRETKIPHEKRVPFPPLHCRRIMDNDPGIRIFIQPDEKRCYSDHEYQSLNISVNEDLSDCDILIGIKEIAIESLLPGKTYMFFSHTAKKQPHNRELLKEILRKKIRLIDYEFLTKDNVRVVAFGHYAGIVGAYNAMRGYGLRGGHFELKPAWQCFDREELFGHLNGIEIGPLKVVITGGGRVAHGAKEILTAARFTQVSPNQLLNGEFDHPVFSQLDPVHYVKRIDGKKFDLAHFFSNPEAYESIFLPYTRVADMYIACHYWDPRSPRLMRKEDYRAKDFRIKIIADISCDMDGPIPSTLRPSSIDDPYYGYDPVTGRESDPFNPDNITVMAVDNLPGELPRDSSEEFGNQLEKEIIPALTGRSDPEIINRAVIAENGSLTERFSYLKDYAGEIV